MKIQCPTSKCDNFLKNHPIDMIFVSKSPRSDQLSVCLILQQKKVKIDHIDLVREAEEIDQILAKFVKEILKKLNK